MDAPFGTSLIPKNVENTGENIVFDDVVLGRQCPRVAPMWGSTWAGVAPKRVQLLAKLRHVGPQVGANWSQVGPSWAQAWPCWPKLSPCCGGVGSKQ